MNSWPLAHTQQRLWFLDQLEGIGPAYHLRLPVRLAGHLDEAALVTALAGLAARHEALRTTITVVGGEPRQLVHDSLPLPFGVEDLGAPAPNDASAEVLLRDRLAAIAAAAFDLGRGPLWRAVVLRVAPGDQVLLLVFHHLIADAWSTGILLRDLAALYRAAAGGAAADLPELPLQFVDFAVWQRDLAHDATRAAARTHWQARLAGAPDLLDLPTDRPRPAVQGFRGDRHSVVLPAPATAALIAASRARGTTLFQWLLTAFQWQLACWSGQHDVVVGTPVAGRPRLELENVVGFFANTLALRTRFDGGRSFAETLAGVRAAVLGDLAHQDMPFEELVRLLRPPRTLRHAPVFQVLFALQNAPFEATTFGDLAIRPTEIAASGLARHDLALSAIEFGGELWLHFEYSTELFSAGTVAGFASSFVTLLEATVVAPDTRLADLPLLSPAAAREVLAAGCGPAQPPESVPSGPGAGTLGALVRAAADRHPDAMAVVADDDALTYAELLVRVDALAAGLAARGIGRGDLVAVMLPRSSGLVVMLLAVERVGAAWLPLDPDHPVARRLLILADAEPRLLVLAGPDVGEGGVPATTPAELLAVAGPPPPRCSQADDLLYLIYTSGSTGAPKGVRIGQRGVASFLASMAARPGLAPGERLLALTTVAFDIAVLELFLPLTVGAAVVIGPRGLGADSAALAARLGVGHAGEGITTCQATPATWQALVDHGWGGAPGLRILVGGEVLPPSLAAALLPRCRELWNCYGPTETTVWSTVARVGADAVITVGTPIANTRCHVLDDQGQPVPVGMPGELFIGGLGVALGYHRREALTAARFRTDSFAPAAYPGEAVPRLYATGDRARWRSDGTLEWLGRLDDQIKLRGFRIEPGEVVAALLADPAVSAAVVIRDARGPGDARLVAYAVPSAAADGDTGAGSRASAAALLTRLRPRLPEYMLPAVLVWLPALPRNANGKLDRAALPTPPDHVAAADAPPQPGAEAAVAARFAAVLGVPAVGRDTDFFAAGGHSLLAVRLLARLRSELALDIPLPQLFATPTVAGLVAALAVSCGESALQASLAAPAGANASSSGSAGGQRGTDVAMDLATAPGGATPLHPDRATGARQPCRYPLAIPQRRLWVLEALEPGSSVYHLCWAVRLAGTLDRVALQTAVDGVVARQAALRTVFVAGAGGEDRVDDDSDAVEQLVLPALPVPVEWLPVTGLDASAEASLLAGLVRRPFDLAAGPLLRVTVLDLGDRRLTLAVVVHHIVADGWSLSVLARELSAGYAAALRGTPPALPLLPMQYGDYARQQLAWLAGSERGRQLGYWRTTLAGAPTVLELGAERPRPPTPSQRGARHVLTLPAGLAADVQALAAVEGCTPYMVWLAAFVVLLGRYGGTEDVVLGTPVAGRPRTELEGLIGFFVNTLVLRVGTGGNPAFTGLLARVRSVVRGALAHAELPFEQLVEDLNPPRRPDRSPLVQVLFNFHSEPREPLAFAGTTATSLAVPRTTTKFDLSVGLTELPDGPLLVFEYSTDLFSTAWVERFAADYHAYLNQAMASPGLGLADFGSPAADSVRRAPASIGMPTAPAPRPLARTFAALLAADPDALAVSGRDPAVPDAARSTAWTRAELGSAAAAVAAVLADAGFGAGARIGIACAPGVAQAAAILGAALAGCIAVPLEPGWPAARYVGIAVDAGLAGVLAEPALVAAVRSALPALRVLAVPAPGPANWPALTPVPQADAPAYLLYTSGTTGEPKGVLQTHGAWAAQTAAWSTALRLDTRDRLSSLGSVASDTALQDLGAALASGASLHPLDLRAMAREQLLDRIADDRLTVLHLTPTAYRYLLGEHVSCRQDLSAVRLVVLGGEPARVADLKLWQSRFAGRGRLVNGYGLTESSAVLQWQGAAGATGYGTTLPLGRPLRRGTAWLRDAQGGEASTVGELMLDGRVVAAGYWQRGVVSALATAPAAAFATGDWLRRLPDGSLAWLERRDDRVKIAGNRVELGEVTAALAAVPGITAACVLAVRGGPGGQGGDDGSGDEPVLVGWYESPRALSPTELQQALRVRLPLHAVPARFVAVPAWPRLPNGKVDRAALRERFPARGPVPPAEEAVPPAGLAGLVGIWEELLGRPVGPDDDFFASGGHSLLALRMLARIRRRLGLDVPLLAVFEAATPRRLAARLAALEPVAAPDKSEPIQRLTRGG